MVNMTNINMYLELTMWTHFSQLLWLTSTMLASGWLWLIHWLANVPESFGKTHKVSGPWHTVVVFLIGQYLNNILSSHQGFHPLGDVNTRYNADMETVSTVSLSSYFFTFWWIKISSSVCTVTMDVHTKIIWIIRFILKKTSKHDGHFGRPFVIWIVFFL